MTSKEAIEALGHAGIVVKSASSTVNENQLEAVLNLIAGSGGPADQDSQPEADQAPSSEKAEKGEKGTEVAEKVTDKPEKKTAKKPAKKAAKKTAKKAARKASRRATKKGAEPQAKAVVAEASDSATVEPAEAGTPVESLVESSVEAALQSVVESVADSTAAAQAEEAPDASAERDSEKDHEAEAKPKTRSRRRRARRVNPVTSDAATEATAEESSAGSKRDDASSSTASLHDVEPPLTPEPQQSSEEQATYAPIFLAPQVPAPTPSVEDEGDEPSARESEEHADSGEEQPERQPRPRRRRRGRGRRRDEQSEQKGAADSEKAADAASASSADNADDGDSAGNDEVEHEPEQIEEPQAIKGSTRLEAQRRRRNERREESRKRHVISEAEFLARRESVERTMVVRERGRHDHAGIVTEVGVLEDDLLVEHFVTSDTQTTQIGNIYLGRVQNVLPSMEAAFIDIGTDRNGVIYVGDLNWKLMGVKSRSRKIEHALKAGDQILVQVTKDPIGHKGARLTTHISMAGRFLVYVPGGRSAGISRKLPEPERKRLKEILSEVTPEGSGTIIRTAAEGVSKEAIEADIQRLEQQWQDIYERSEQAKAKRGAKPITLYEEPDMLVKVVRDVFNEDFTRLVVEGDRPWNTVTDYIGDLAPELEPRLQRYFAREHGGADVFEHFRIDEQLAKALDRKVWLPSGGTLIIDRTEAMTVIDVNTGKFTGSGGNLEETVTRNNLEAAEEIVRQMRLRDLGGMIVVDFIDMVLPENQDLVLRRLKEALGRDRSRHEVSEVTSLGLVQMTRKRLGTGLLETFSTPCSCCNGRGIVIHIDPVEHDSHGGNHGGNSHRNSGEKKGRGKRNPEHAPGQHPAALAMHRDHDAEKGSAENGRQDAKPSRNDESDALTTSAQDKAAADERVAAAVEAVVVASEKEEPKPPRRRSRRGRGRGRHAEGNDASQDQRNELPEQPQPQPEATEDAGDKLAALAAAAVAEAREKDPEEPSDDRYVAGPSHRRRRATRRRVAEHLAVDKSDEEHQERAQREERNERPEPEATREDSRADGGRRRSRRARRSGSNGRPHAGSPQVETARGESDVNRGSDAGRDRDSERVTGRDGGNLKKSYEDAVEEFERSPRRRRPTRGNSRSDRAPRREDFEPAAQESREPEAAAPSTVAEAEKSRPDSEGRERSGRTASARRRRRRAVRTASVSEAAGAVADAEETTRRNGAPAHRRSRKPQPDAEQRGQGQAEQGATEEAPHSASRRRSGRPRRAVRRSVR